MYLLLILENPGSVGVQKLKIPFACMLSRRKETTNWRMQLGTETSDEKAPAEPVNMPHDAQLNSFYNTTHTDGHIAT